MPEYFAHLRVNTVFSSLLAAFEMKYISERSVAAAVACVVRLFNLINI